MDITDEIQYNTNCKHFSNMPRASAVEGAQRARPASPRGTGERGPGGRSAGASCPPRHAEDTAPRMAGTRAVPSLGVKAAVATPRSAGRGHETGLGWGDVATGGA